MLEIISGEMTDSGEIKDFPESIYMKAKDEVDNADVSLIPLNTGRIWFDNDRISEKISVYSGRIASSDQSNKTFSMVGTDK